MPSKYSVALSLDTETFGLWEALPIGERSKRVRAALSNADLVRQVDAHLEAIQRQRDHLRTKVGQLIRSNEELRLYGCGVCRCDCVKENINSKGELV